MMLLSVIAWYLTLALAGWLVFPLAYRVLAFLPDRGFSLIRSIGLLFWGYVFWLLASLRILQNSAGGALLALILVGALAALFLRGNGWKEITGWVHENRKYVFGVELLFLLAFIAWTVVRAAAPEAVGTEKPMELAFINSILRSPSYPPADPWLSGYAISYYYFGYAMVAMLAKTTAIPGAVAFNLGIATWFALTSAGAYGILNNLLSLRKGGKRPGHLLSSLLAPFMVLTAGNVEGLLEMLHARGLFWSETAGGGWTSGFWKWLDIQELTSPPSQPFDWQPERLGGIWWWRASRVLQDYALDGSRREIIDEFPMFSYLLGDLHPHVLAMPFVLLAIGLALNVYLQLRAAAGETVRAMDWVKRPLFWVAAITLGGLAFLNTWDFPIYLALFAAAAALGYVSANGWRFEAGILFVWLMVGLGLTGGILYIPFYLSFASQANGLLPSLVFFTRGAHFWVMFGIQLVPIILWLAWNCWKNRKTVKVWHGFLMSAGLIGGLWLLSLLYGFFRLRSDPGLAGIWGIGDPGVLLTESVLKRFSAPGVWLTLLGVIALGFALLHAWNDWGERRNIAALEAPRIYSRTGEPGALFTVLLFLLGAGLAIFPEFFYLRDQFGYRMNTIFKFYFQVWVLWGIAASFGVVVLLDSFRGGAKLAFQLGLALWIVVSLPYAYFGILSRTNKLQPVEWSLDGSRYIAQYFLGEMQAIQWLRNAPYGVVVEAVGGSYSGYARVSTHSGLPTVLGWPGHEMQWRGGAKEIGSRETDVRWLYKTGEWNQVRSLLDQYQIRYVYVGPTEQRDYKPDIDMYKRYMPVVFENDQVIIFEYSATVPFWEQTDRP